MFGHVIFELHTTETLNLEILYEKVTLNVSLHGTRTTWPAQSMAQEYAQPSPGS